MNTAEILREAGPKVYIFFLVETFVCLPYHNLGAKPHPGFTCQRNCSQIQHLTTKTRSLLHFYQLYTPIFILTYNLVGRVLRLLATEHIFKEVSPDIFANNRLSSVLDTGKRLDDILAVFVFRSVFATAEAFADKRATFLI